jgi:hypothetical protein
VCRVLHRCAAAKHAAVYVVTLPPLPPERPSSVETKVLQSRRSKHDQEMEEGLTRQYWDAYNLARTVHGVTADVQPKSSGRAAYVQIDAIDYDHVSRIDADFREPPPVTLANGVVLKAGPKLRRYPAGTCRPPALAPAGEVSTSSVVPYTWDGMSWACHKRDASIIMWDPSPPHLCRILFSGRVMPSFPCRYSLPSPPVGTAPPHATVDDGQDDATDRLMAIELPLGMEGGGRGGLAAFVAATGQPMLTTNASSHHAHSPFPYTQCARPPPESMMLAPVFLQGWDGSTGAGRIAMVLEVGDRVDGGSYTRDDVVLLSTLSRSLSSVLEHVESNERAAAQASNLLSSSGAAIFPPHSTLSRVRVQTRKHNATCANPTFTF